MATIAIIDDSKMARTFASAVLRKVGHEVVELEPLGLEKLLEQLRVIKPQLIVLDHFMPAFSGPTLVRACFQDEFLAAIKIIILSAHHEDGLEARMEKLGVHAALHKPIDTQDLVDVVTKVLGS